MRSFWNRLKTRTKCEIFGHQNSGEFYHSVRVWQRCRRCDGILGWMFRWEEPWTREDGLKALEREDVA